MSTSRLWPAAAGGTFLVLCCLLLAASPMHTTPPATPENPRPLDALSRSSRQPSSAEQLLFDSANRERAGQGLSQLKWDDLLAAAARKHAALMADQNEMSHRLTGEPALEARIAQTGARFSSVGENVAVGPDAAGIHNGWMHSPGHRANILGVGFNALGVGVAERDGQLYAVQDFSASVEPLSIEQQEKKVGAMLTARGFRLSQEQDDTTEARKICASGSTRPTSMHPAHPSMEIFRFETPDLASLTPQLDRSLRGSKFHEAAVGACSQDSTDGTPPYFRVVILLFTPY